LSSVKRLQWIAVASFAVLALVGGGAPYHVTHRPKPVYCQLENDTIGMTEKEAASYEAWWRS
jgi:hypothetical protein